MAKGGGATQRVNKYYLSIHYGVCLGADAITGIYVGEKPAWSGEVTAPGPIGLNLPDLFGGEKKEGGIGGIAYWLPGDRDQVLPEGLAARRGLTSATSPAYRGLASVYFVGTGATSLGDIGDLFPGLEARVSGAAGFYWGATPYIQNCWITCRRAPKGLDPNYALIGNQVNASLNGYDATIGGETVHLTDGVLALVAGHSVSLSVSGVDGTKTINIDGTAVIVEPFIHDPDDDNNHLPGITVTVEGTDQVMHNGTVTISGVTVTVSGATVGIQFGSAGADANPSHIIYECMSNPTWGMNASDGIVDAANFESVGRVLFNEGFGLSILWTKESTIESFIGEVLDHIQAAIYVDPDTGKMTIKLFRDDFDADTLPLISPDNAVLDNFQRKLWGETVNEITVTWTNPVNEQEETITQQDLGNITVQGATVGDSRNYYGVRNAALASRLAIRDVRQSSAPLASVEALLDRTQWNLKPGSVVRLTWPEYNIVNLVMRVMNIDYGKIGDPSITVTLLEDIFSLEDAAFDLAPDTGFNDPARDPTPLDHVKVMTSPAYFTMRRLTAADAQQLTYPDVLSNILGASSNTDANFYEVVGQTTLSNGTTVSERRGTKGLLGYATVGTALAREATTVVPSFGPVTNGIGPNVAGFVFIGDGTERTMEIALIESFTDGVGWTLQRGVLDTVPRAWPVGTSMWFYDVRNDFFDADIHSEAEAVAYKLLTITSRGPLDAANSPVYGEILTARPHLPNRPANIAFNGNAGFAPLDLSGSSPTSVVVTWANRNRTLEDNTVVKWTDATVMPETGQTTNIKLAKVSDGSTLANHTGLTGTSFTIPLTDFGSEIEADIYVSSSRDGFDSLQTFARRVRVIASGTAPGDPPDLPGGGGDTPYEPPQDDYPPPYFPPGNCPEENELVLLANRKRNGPGGTKRAGDLKPWVDWVWTQPAIGDHEVGPFGAYLVSGVDIVRGHVFKAPRMPRTTPGHRWWTNRGWMRMRYFGKPDGDANVVRITVDRAQTFVLVHGKRWLLSHNLKQNSVDNF